MPPPPGSLGELTQDPRLSEPWAPQLLKEERGWPHAPPGPPHLLILISLEPCTHPPWSKSVHLASSPASWACENGIR